MELIKTELEKFRVYFAETFPNWWENDQYMPDYNDDDLVGSPGEFLPNEVPAEHIPTGLSWKSSPITITVSDTMVDEYVITFNLLNVGAGDFSADNKWTSPYTELDLDVKEFYDMVTAEINSVKPIAIKDISYQGELVYATQTADNWWAKNILEYDLQFIKVNRTQQNFAPLPLVEEVGEEVNFVN